MEKEKRNTFINRERRESPGNERTCRRWRAGRERREEREEEEEDVHSAGTLPGALRLEAGPVSGQCHHGDTKRAGLGIPIARLLNPAVIQIPVVVVVVILKVKSPQLLEHKTLSR